MWAFVGATGARLVCVDGSTKTPHTCTAVRIANSLQSHSTVRSGWTGRRRGPQRRCRSRGATRRRSTGETGPFGLPTCSECWVVQAAYRCYAHCGSRVSCASRHRRVVESSVSRSLRLLRASCVTDVRDGRSLTASTTPMSAFCATKPSTTNTPPGPTDNNKPLDTNHPWDVLAGCVQPSSNTLVSKSPVEHR